MKVRVTRAFRSGKSSTLSRVLAVGLIVGCSLGAIQGTATATTREASKVTTVKVATSQFIGQAISQIVGLDPGVCKPYGIDVKLVSVNDAAAVAGQQSGSVQFGVFTAALQSISEGQASNIVVLAYLGDPPLNAGGIWGPPSIKTAKQLVGKKLDGLAGGPDALNTLLMSSRGIKTSQYSVVQFGNITAYFAAPASGQVNAAWDVAPLPPSWVSAKFHNIIPLPKSDGYTQDVYLTASKSYASAHPAVVENFLRCYAAGLRAGRSKNAATRSTLGSAIAKYDLVSRSEALQVLSSYPQSNALEVPNITETVKATAFYAGAPANKARLQAALAPRYLKAAGVQVAPTNVLGPTTW